MCINKTNLPVQLNIRKRQRSDGYHFQLRALVQLDPHSSTQLIYLAQILSQVLPVKQSVNSQLVVAKMVLDAAVRSFQGRELTSLARLMFRTVTFEAIYCSFSF